MGEPATTPTKAVIPSTVASTAAPWARSRAAMPCPRKRPGVEREVLFSRGDEANVRVGAGGQ